MAGLTIQLNGGQQATTHTDASGFYSFAGLGTGTYSINLPSIPAGCSVTPANVNGIVFGATQGASTQNFSASAGCLPAGAAVMPTSGATLDALYTPHVFQKTFGYDEANRVVTETTGADIAQLAANGSQVATSYLPQGPVQSVTSSYGSLLANQLVDAQGSAVEQVFGDAAGTKATMNYDSGERLTGYALSRGAGPNNGAWAAYAPGQGPTTGDPQNTLQTVLTNLVLGYDRADNLKSQNESTNATSAADGASIPVVDTHWPTGYEPTSARAFSYGDDYRLQTASAQYAGPGGGDDAFTPAYTPAEVEASTYPAQASVAPKNTRMRNQTFAYDARGNLTNSTDDTNAFFDRSLGTITNGPAGGVAGPDQLGSATLGSATVSAQYDLAGNLTAVTDFATHTAYAYACGTNSVNLASATAHGRGRVAADVARDVRLRCRRRAGAHDHAGVWQHRDRGPQFVRVRLAGA